MELQTKRDEPLEQIQNFVQDLYQNQDIIQDTKKEVIGKLKEIVERWMVRIDELEKTQSGRQAETRGYEDHDDGLSFQLLQQYYEQQIQIIQRQHDEKLLKLEMEKHKLQCRIRILTEQNVQKQNQIDYLLQCLKNKQNK